MEIENMWHFKTTRVLVIVGTLGMIKKETEKRINKIPDNPNQYEKQKMHFAELLISLEECYQCVWKISPKRGSKKPKCLE